MNAYDYSTMTPWMSTNAVWCKSRYLRFH